jgi:hypothetical protein
MPIIPIWWLTLAAVDSLWLASRLSPWISSIPSRRPGHRRGRISCWRSPTRKPGGGSREEACQVRTCRISAAGVYRHAGRGVPGRPVEGAPTAPMRELACPMIYIAANPGVHDPHPAYAATAHASLRITLASAGSTEIISAVLSLVQRPAYRAGGGLRAAQARGPRSRRALRTARPGPAALPSVRSPLRAAESAAQETRGGL